MDATGIVRIKELMDQSFVCLGTKQIDGKEYKWYSLSPIMYDRIFPLDSNKFYGNVKFKVTRRRAILSDDITNTRLLVTCR